MPAQFESTLAGQTQHPRIIITGDALRCERPAVLYGQLSNTRWLHGLFDQPITEATGVCPELVFTSFSDDIDVSDIYHELGLPLDSSGWIKLFDALPDHIIQRLYGDIEGALIIGFELSPSWVDGMVRLGARVLNVGIHPVRFMDDIFLAIETPHRVLAEGLARHAMPERLAYRAAGLIKAFTALDPLTRFPAPAAVFAGQLPIDRSLIRDGRLITADDLGTTINENFARFETVLLKPHPLALENPVIDKIESLGLTTHHTEFDFYHLVSHPDVTAVISISSGTCQEAPYFGKEGLHLSHCPTPCLWREHSPEESGWWSIYDDFLVPDFWRSILAPVMEVTPMDEDRPPAKPNRLRIALHSFWGFAGIDPRTIVANGGIAPNFDRLREDLTFLSRLHRRLVRFGNVPVLGWLLRRLIRTPQ